MWVRKFTKWARVLAAGETTAFIVQVADMLIRSMYHAGRGTARLTSRRSRRRCFAIRATRSLVVIHSWLTGTFNFSPIAGIRSLGKPLSYRIGIQGMTR